LPAGVPSGQLGPRALALVGTLAGQFHLTQRKVQAGFCRVSGVWPKKAVSLATFSSSKAVELIGWGRG
jgi:hypothetical protein